MYENKFQRPVSRAQFHRRLARHCATAMALLLLSLLIGVFGHVYFEAQTWHDAFLNATMMLGGIGPVIVPQTVGGKLFIGLYGLYIGLVFVAAIGVILAPIAHRLLHQMHWDEDA